MKAERVLSLLRRHDSMTAHEIAALAHCSKATIYRVLKQLSDERLIQVIPGDGSKGQPALYFLTRNRVEPSHEPSQNRLRTVSEPSQNETVGNGFKELPPYPPTVSHREPPVTAERAAEWQAAIACALNAGLRHSPECFAAKTPMHGCPWCEFIMTTMRIWEEV